jgi:integrase
MSYFVDRILGASPFSPRKVRQTPRMNPSMLFDGTGNRKYLTIAERRAFIAAAPGLRPQVETLCLILAYTGARISEVLALTPSRIDCETCVVIVETLKRRQSGVFRAIPVPRSLIARLDAVHDTMAAQKNPDRCDLPLWAFSRTTAWSYIKRALRRIGVAEARAMPKALRHGFAAGCLEDGVPLNMVQKWMGHARITTTALYGNLVGKEERRVAGRMWKSLAKSDDLRTGAA